MKGLPTSYGTTVIQGGQTGVWLKGTHSPGLLNAEVGWGTAICNGRTKQTAFERGHPTLNNKQVWLAELMASKWALSLVTGHGQEYKNHMAH